MSSVDIKSETDSLRPDSPKCGESLLNSEYTLHRTKNGHTLIIYLLSTVRNENYKEKLGATIEHKVANYGDKVGVLL